MLTVKQEAFCQAYIENGGNASEAYRTAYDASKMKAETVNKRASELMANGEVAGRVTELRKAIEIRHEITIDDLIAELEEARSTAYNLTTPQVSAAIAATMGKAKMLGFLTDKQEITGANGGPVQMGIQVSFVNPSKG